MPTWKAYRNSPKWKAYRKAQNAAISAKSRSRPYGHDLYIMAIDRFPGEFKVGRAADPQYRAKNMSAGYPWHVDVVGVFEGFGEHEKLVHEALSSYMVSTPKKQNTEWFRLPYEELIEKINSAISQFEH